MAIGIVWCDDDEAALVELEVPFEQRQRTAADRAETDHHDRAGDLAVDGPIRHSSKLLGSWG
ncbi:hypothetical protein D3C87_2141720 [compost metagenome]